MGDNRAVALVTGAAVGLGGAIAHALARRDHDLVLNDLATTGAVLFDASCGMAHA